MNPNQNVVTTSDLHVAVFLRATNRLRFLGCKTLRDDGRLSEFIFEGTPEQMGDAEQDFLNGAGASVQATLDSYRQLRGAINRARFNVRQ